MSGLGFGVYDSGIQFREGVEFAESSAGSSPELLEELVSIGGAVLPRRPLTLDSSFTGGQTKVGFTRRLLLSWKTPTSHPRVPRQRES